jgi:Putative MetA-pathway of phenol degradation
MKHWVRVAAVAMAAACSTPSWACSICRCGDPTFNALGIEGVSLTGLRLAFDWDQVKKSQGIPGEDFDSLRERRSTFLVAWNISDRFGVFARVPFTDRDLQETEDGETDTTHTSGLADPEIYGQLRLWKSNFEGDVGIRSAIYAVAGIKTDWGENDASRGGERLDEHAQPGTGSTDWFAGLSGSYQIDPRSALFASVQYRHTGTNEYGYRYGRIKLLNLAYEHKLGTSWDAKIQVNYRDSGRDQVDATRAMDPDTGGSIAYLTPQLAFDARKGWVLRASLQIPLSQSGLNGYQDEKVVVNFGVTRLFLQ